MEQPQYGAAAVWSSHSMEQPVEKQDLIDTSGASLYTAPAARLLHFEQYRLVACAPSEAVSVFTFCLHFLCFR